MRGLSATADGVVPLNMPWVSALLFSVPPSGSFGEAVLLLWRSWGSWRDEVGGGGAGGKFVASIRFVSSGGVLRLFSRRHPSIVVVEVIIEFEFVATVPLAFSASISDEVAGTLSYKQGWWGFPLIWVSLRSLVGVDDVESMDLSVPLVVKS